MFRFPSYWSRAALATALMVAASFSAAQDSDSKSTENTTAKASASRCEDARTQAHYWCEEREKVSVVSMGLECENAKRNVAEACEGIAKETTTYK